jgi:hypothetical protein
MDMIDSTPKETEPVPAAAPAPVVPVPAPVAVAPLTAAPAPVAAVKMEIPQTKGTTPGGWNRFAGYNRNDAKNKQKKGPSKRF